MNDVIIETTAWCLLAHYGIAYTPDMQVRCIAHVLNLVVQAFLYGMDEALNPDDINYYEDHKDGPIHYNIDKDEEQLAMENEDLSQDEMANPDMERVPLSIDEECETVNSMGGESAIKWVLYSPPRILRNGILAVLPAKIAISIPRNSGRFRNGHGITKTESTRTESPECFLIVIVIFKSNTNYLIVITINY